MKYDQDVTFNWDDRKNEWLKQERGVSFEEIILEIHDGKVVAVLEHPNLQQYPSQRLYLVRFRDYIYVVPFVERNDEIFLITIFPSRLYTRRFLTGEANDDQS